MGKRSKRLERLGRKLKRARRFAVAARTWKETALRYARLYREELARTESESATLEADRDHWHQRADANWAQLGEERECIATLEAELYTYQAWNDGNANAVATANERIAALEGRVAGSDQYIAELQRQRQQRDECVAALEGLLRQWSGEAITSQLIRETRAALATGPAAAEAPTPEPTKRATACGPTCHKWGYERWHCDACEDARREDGPAATEAAPAFEGTDA